MTTAVAAIAHPFSHVRSPCCCSRAARTAVCSSGEATAATPASLRPTLGSDGYQQLTAALAPTRSSTSDQKHDEKDHHEVRDQHVRHRRGHQAGPPRESRGG